MIREVSHVCKTHIVDILTFFKFLIDISCSTDTWLSNTETK